MKQDRFRSLLTSLIIIVDQDLVTQIDYNNVIEEFKALIPKERRLKL